MKSSLFPFVGLDEWIKKNLRMNEIFLIQLVKAEEKEDPGSFIHYEKLWIFGALSWS